MQKSNLLKPFEFEHRALSTKRAIYGEKNNVKFPNVIDLDLPNIPNRLLYHLSEHKNVFIRETRNGFHIISTDYRCPICDSYCDPNFINLRNNGKPLLLWHRKRGKSYSPWFRFRNLSLYWRQV